MKHAVKLFQKMTNIRIRTCLDNHVDKESTKFRRKLKTYDFTFYSAHRETHKLFHKRKKDTKVCYMQHLDEGKSGN